MQGTDGCSITSFWVVSTCTQSAAGAKLVSAWLFMLVYKPLSIITTTTLQVRSAYGDVWRVFEMALIHAVGRPIDCDGRQPSRVPGSFLQQRRQGNPRRAANVMPRSGLARARRLPRRDSQIVHGTYHPCEKARRAQWTSPGHSADADGRTSGSAAWRARNRRRGGLADYRGCSVERPPMFIPSATDNFQALSSGTGPARSLCQIQTWHRFIVTSGSSRSR